MIAKTVAVRVSLVLSTLLLIGAGLGDLYAAEEKKKKKKESEESSEVTDALKKIDRKLLGYDTESARKLLDKLPADDSKVMIAEGRLLTLEMEYEDAIAKLSSATDARKSDPTPALYLGEAYYYANRSDEATAAFSRAATRAEKKLVKKPEDFRSLYSLGVAKQRLKDYDEALEHLEAAREEKSSDALVLYQLGLTHYLSGDWGPAVDLLTKAIERNSGIAYAYYYRGMAADEVGRKDLLVNDMDRFLFLAPNAPEAPLAQRILQGARG